MVIIFYGATALNAYINNIVAMHDSDGRCHFGIQGIVSIPFTVINFFTDIVLTGVFFYLLRPIANAQNLSVTHTTLDGTPSKRTRLAGPGQEETPVQRNMRTLLWKSIIGSLLIEIPMAANMIQFVVTEGEELGMICLSVCLLDGKAFHRTISKRTRI